MRHMTLSYAMWHMRHVSMFMLMFYNWDKCLWPECSCILAVEKDMEQKWNKNADHFQTLNNTLHTWSCLRYTLWFHVAHRWSRPSLILWASKHNWLPHHSEHHCSIKVDQIKLANDLNKTAQFQPDQNLFKFIKDFILHTSTPCWSRCFQISFKSRYYIVLGSSFPWKAQKSIQTSHATIHGLAKDELLANMNQNFEINFRCALWEHGEKVTDKLYSDCRYETQQKWHKRQHTKKTLVEGLFTIHLSMFLKLFLATKMWGWQPCQS